MTIDPSKNMDIDAILEDLYRSEINASISGHCRVVAFTRRPAAQRLWVQYRDAYCAFYGIGRVDPAGLSSRMHTLDDGRPGARTRKAMKFD